MPDPAYRGQYTVPVPGDPPDVPLAFRSFADNQWHNNTQANAQEWTGRIVYQDEGGHFGPGVELVGLDLPADWPTRTLMLIHTNFLAGVYAQEVIGYHWLEGDGGVLTPQWILSGQPSGSSYSMSILRVKQTAPGGRISLKCRMDQGNIMATNRTLSIWALTRG